MTLKDLPRMRRLQKSTQLCWRWQSFNLAMDEDGREVVPEALSNEEPLELGQEHLVKEKAGKKGNCRREKEPPRKFTMKDLAETFADVSQPL